MSDEYFFFIALLSLLVIIPVGIFFLFKKKRKPILSIDEYIASKNWSDSERTIRTKELHKQTAPTFSKEWFKEYWHGQRSPFYAVNEGATLI
jgi:hypothetical protein